MQRHKSCNKSKKADVNRAVREREREGGRRGEVLIIFSCVRIRSAIEEKVKIIDVDGSYLYKKSKRLQEMGLVTVPMPTPAAPLSGWEPLTENTAESVGAKIPRVTTGALYKYLSSHSGRDCSDGTFRELTRGYTHWASGRIDNLEINIQHPVLCRVRSTMKPSMKKGLYNVWILLKREDPYGSVEGATCTCAAG